MRRMIFPTVLAASIALLTARATAQTGEGTAEGSSFAEVFFISTKFDPATGATSVELIGSVLIWFLLLLSALSLGLMGHMAMTNRRTTIVPDRLVDEVRRRLHEGDFKHVLELTRQDESFFSRVLQAGLREASHGFSAIVRALEQTADELTTNRLRRLEYLNVLGNVAPMIGLFGTVYGMILAFQGIKATGGNADPAVLAGGIGTALVTTFWGLLVAIPALAGYAVLRNKVDELTTEATLRAEELIYVFRPKAKSQAGSGKSHDETPAAARTEHAAN